MIQGEEVTEEMETLVVGGTTQTPSPFSPFEQKAMDSSYDEDLNENPFFQSLITSCPDLFGQCVLEQWLICVPRRDSLPKYTFTLEDFTHHILRPVTKANGRHWSGESNCSSISIGSLPSSCGSLGSSSVEDQSHRWAAPPTSASANFFFASSTSASDQNLCFQLPLPTKIFSSNFRFQLKSSHPASSTSASDRFRPLPTKIFASSTSASDQNFLF
ncbi:hypothetical protein Fcan01_19421 [Folsomia candida]|uniref:Uncharacterized protein n=1 Tax=Folsomia candida TaxID=158441 RepID=A0A226DMV4_FOLCA|nr:hypothetical protein Fcan01_19421 [Folsomia candida]